MRRVGQYAIIVFQVLLIVSLVRGIQLSKRSDARIASLQGEKARLLAEQDRLETQKDYVESPYYLEKVARDELHLGKPGETVVIVPDSRKQEIGTRDQDLEVETEKANWQKWWEVLSGSR